MESLRLIFFKIDRSAKKAHGWQNSLFDVGCSAFDVQCSSVSFLILPRAFLASGGLQML